MSRHLLAIVCILMLPSFVPAQSFLGKGADAWTRELSTASDPKTRANAAFALGKLGGYGASGVSELKKVMRGETNPKVKEAAVQALGEIARESIKVGGDPELVPLLCQSLKDKDHLVRRSAAVALGHLGGDAVTGLASLEEALADPMPEVRQNAAWAMGKLGDKAVPGLRKALRDSDQLVKRDAAGSLGQIDPEAAHAALPELLDACRTGNSQVRAAALAVLVKTVGAEDKDAVAAIKPALADTDVEVRRNAALAISNIGGKDAVDALPILMDALRRGETEIKRQSALAIRNLGPAAKGAVDTLIQALADPDEETRGMVALALGGLKEGAEKAVPALVTMIADGKEARKNRTEAAMALSRIGSTPAALKAVPTLLKILEDPNHDGRVRERIVWALRVHTFQLRDLPGIYPAFTAVVGEPRTDDTRMLRYDCAYMLGVLRGADAPSKALDVLNEYLHDKTILIYVSTKSSVGGTSTETVGGKAAVKEVGKGDGRVLAVQALKEIGGAKLRTRPEIVTQLRELAADAAIYADLREKCKELLGLIGK